MLTVYSKSNCQQCVQAKTLLTKKNIPFKEVKIDETSAAREFILNAGHKTLPQIYSGDSLFVEGGYFGLAGMSDKQLKERLNLQTC